MKAGQRNTESKKTRKTEIHSR